MSSGWQKRELGETEEWAQGDLSGGEV